MANLLSYFQIAFRISIRFLLLVCVVFFLKFQECTEEILQERETRNSDRARRFDSQSRSVAGRVYLRTGFPHAVDFMIFRYSYHSEQRLFPTFQGNSNRRRLSIGLDVEGCDVLGSPLSEHACCRPTRRATAATPGRHTCSPCSISRRESLSWGRLHSSTGPNVIGRRASLC